MKSILALFAEGIIVRDPHRLKSSTRRGTSVETEFRLCRMKYGSSDNRYTTTPQMVTMEK